MGENLEGKITWSINIIDWKLNGPKNKLGSTIIYWTDMENIFIVHTLWEAFLHSPSSQYNIIFFLQFVCLFQEEPIDKLERSIDKAKAH